MKISDKDYPGTPPKPVRNDEIISMAAVGDHNIDEIADHFDISSSRVCQVVERRFGCTVTELRDIEKMTFTPTEGML